MADELDQRKPERQSYTGYGGMGPGASTLGITLVLVGGYFLLRNVFGIDIDNWWAIFILIPAIFLLGTTARFYSQDGSITPRVAQSAAPACMMILVALIFLFDLDWGTVWPLFLIVGGLFAILASRRS